MNIGLCPSPQKPDASKYTSVVARLLTKRGAHVYIDPDYPDSLDLPPITTDTPLDILITLGGDGTLLYYRKKYSHRTELLFTAINLGGLGFMADVQLNEIEIYLNDLMQGDYTVEERVTLEGRHGSHLPITAANDYVFHRGSIPSMILLRVTINNDHFNTFQADGLIVSTPTGSSAYSLACGGPLMHPSLKAFVLTTISGHTLTNRPFVIPHDSVIKIEYLSENQHPIDVTVDGMDTYPLKPKEVVELRCSSTNFCLVKYFRHNFYQTVRLKLHWKGKSTI